MHIEEFDSCLQCQFKEKTESSLHFCKVHQIALKFPRWTCCVHFATTSTVAQEIPHPPKAPLFRAGLYEEKLATVDGKPFQGYPRIPWHLQAEPHIYAKGACLECGKTFSSGIEVLDQNEPQKFCGNSHYVQWWKRKHPHTPLSWDYEWKSSTSHSTPSKKEDSQTQNLFEEEIFSKIFDENILPFEEENFEAENNEPAPLGIKIVQEFLDEAIQSDVTEIHVECHEKEFIVYFRRDGTLTEAHRYSQNYFNQVVARCKIFANVDIAERRLPQQGSFQWKSHRFLLKTFPTYRYERLMLECFHPVEPPLILEDLGFTPKNLGFFTSAFYKKHGIILHSGPHASGKKTAIYAALEERCSPQNLIFTIEQSLKKEFSSGIQQSQINSSLNLTYANLLHYAVKQNPQIIYVEKIVDRETLEKAIETALSGILLFASIPAFSTLQVLQRLSQLEIDPAFFSAVLRAILAHQLVRRLCFKCRKPYTPSPEQQKMFSALPELDLSTLQLYQPGSCDSCYRSGYRGQIGIQEVLLIDEKIREKLVQKAGPEEIYPLALATGMKTLWQDALFKAKEGWTTLEEILRHIPRDPF